MIERVNEINRLLLAIRSLGSGPEQQIPLGSVLRICAESVQGGMLPDHMLTIEYASVTGLVSTAGDFIRLTEGGAEFIELNPGDYYELTLEQRQVLARNHYLGGTHQAAARAALSGFHFSTQQDRLVWSELDDSPLECPAWILDHLCQLDVLSRTETGYETTEDMSAVAVGFLEEPRGLTEEKLRAILADKAAIGDIGERLVLKFERDRLSTAGAIVESHCVRRIGNVRVSAGYDIESFDGLSQSKLFDRFIEVKAAKSKTLHFFWTANEMKVAEKYGERYWIYFLGGVNAAKQTATQQPLMFQNPLVSIMDNADISKVSQGLIIASDVRGAER